MPTRTLNVVIAGDSKQLGVASRQADRHMEDTEKRAGRMGNAVKAGFGIAAAGAGLLVVGLKKSVDAAIEAEKSQARMTAQLRASGISYRAHAKEIDAVIQKHSRLAGVDDEELQDAFTNIVRTTGSVTKAMNDMGLVTDLMRARNISAAKAGDLLAKVHNGNVGALKRLGIAIDPVTKATDALRESNKKATAEQIRAAKKADETATAQRALAALQKRFGGQAEAYGKTAAGAQDRFGVAVENLQEKIGGKLLPVLTKATLGVAKFAGEMEDGRGSGGSFARQINSLTRALKPYSDATEDVVNETKRHESVMKALGEVFPNPMRSIRVFTGLLNGLKATANGVVAALKGVASAAKAAGNAAKDAGGFLLPGIVGGGDGPGKSPLPSGTFGGNLMGARPSMAPFASAASRFGLRVSSGKRPGSITSSGNVSYHSSGEAIDVAGSPAGMLGFFRQMKATAGSRLAELIYTPGGAGVKNGRSYTYGGQVAADHFDHVHVAYDTGVPGVGDGIGQAASAARSAGFRGDALVEAVAIAGAESRYDAEAQNLVPPDHSIGFWQINQLAHHGRFGTDAQLKNPFTNAKAAFALWKESGFRPWSTYPTAAAGYLAKARLAVSGSSGSSGSKSKPKTAGSGGTTSTNGGPSAAAKNAPVSPIYSGEAVSNPLGGMNGAQAFAQAMKPTKGGGPTKGFPAGYTPPEPVDTPAGPTWEDYVNSGIARARLTEDKSDDIAAYTTLVGLREAQKNAALSDADPRNDADAIDAYLSATEALKALTDSIDQSNEIQRQRDELDKTIADNQGKILALAQQGPQIVAAVVAAVSGGIGGQIGLGMQTPSFAGGVARYGVGGL